MTYTQICPRCEQPNQCGYSDNPDTPSCWCTQLVVPEPLGKRIQDKWGSTSCLCKGCLAELIENFEGRDRSPIGPQ